ncbi:MAG: hypothetical protein JWP87_918 [Labilithrix sp.]|jgi:hypothetical protein|nr:hypothetical protein [Labilithrix sp.]
MRLRHVAALATLAAVGAFAACTLNPQPLPPGGGDNEATFSDAGKSPDAGSLGENPMPPPNLADAGVGAADGEGGADGGDEAGDGGSDAEAGADGG